METFDILEQKILKLLDTIDNLEGEKRKLTDKIKEKEEEARRLTGEIEGLLAERDQAKVKIADLIKRIEEY